MELDEPPSSDPEVSIRSTQRVPRSCKFCSARKIKCDKQIPCGQCRSRGRGEQCQIEVVRVKGWVVRNGQASQPSYAQLLHENQRLRADLDAATNSSRSGGQSSPADALRPHLRMNMLDQHEQRLYTALKLHHREPTVTGIHQVLFPSSECAAILFDHGARWMWLHMAVDHQQFQMEATVYHAKCRIASPHQAAEASWLGLYFAYLTVTLLIMDADEHAAAMLPYSDADTVLNNWFDAAIFFLQKADFMRVLDFRNIQTMTILCVCFANFGDFNMFYNFLSIAARTSHCLGLTVDGLKPDETPVGAQLRQRMWWELVISDWLTFQLGPTCIRSDDFHVAMPCHDVAHVADHLHHHSPNATTVNNSCNSPPQVHWLVAASQMSRALYRFQSSLPSVDDPDRDALLSAAIAHADNELADVIGGLPAHLSPENDEVFSGEEAEDVSTDAVISPPWVSFQKLSVTVLLLYYRIVINRVASKYHASDGARATLICLDSAHALVRTVLDSPAAHTRPLVWFLLLPLYSAASVLAVNAANCRCESPVSHKANVEQCIAYFTTVSRRSPYAARAAEALKELAGYEFGMQTV